MSPFPPFLTIQYKLSRVFHSASYPGARISPPLDDPIKFRTSGIDACDHSESFLFSYDLHRLYNDPQRPPRIYMNPTVKVAYLPKWYRWQNTVLRIGVVKWYVGKSSFGSKAREVGLTLSLIGMIRTLESRCTSHVFRLDLRMGFDKERSMYLVGFEHA